MQKPWCIPMQILCTLRKYLLVHMNFDHVDFEEIVLLMSSITSDNIFQPSYL